MSFATAQDAIEFIEGAAMRPPDVFHLLPPPLRSITRYPYMDALMAELGHPETGLRVAHITGTSGKGSTATMLQAIAHAAGLRTGLYTSPYLTIPQERIQIDGVPIADALFIASTAEVAAALARLTARLTDFAPHLKMIWVAVMLVAFARARVELAVIEVGMGGRYDETNVVTPATATIVSVGLDHQATLGATLPEIAFHKAGIIKAHAPVISGVTEAAPRRIIQAQARLVGAPLSTLATDFHLDDVQITRHGTRFAYTDPSGALPDCRLRLVGQHYAHNAALAIRTARALVPQLTDATIYDGLTHAWLPGRCELVGQRPTVLLDIAHNPDKLRALAETVATLFPDAPIWLVFGVMENKDVGQILGALQWLRHATFIMTEPPMPYRAVTSASTLAAQAAALGLPAEIVRDPQAAVRYARQRAAPDDLIIVTGSLYLVSAVRAGALGTSG